MDCKWEFSRKTQGSPHEGLLEKLPIFKISILFGGIFLYWEEAPHHFHRKKFSNLGSPQVAPIMEASIELSLTVHTSYV